MYYCFLSIEHEPVFLETWWPIYVVRFLRSNILTIFDQNNNYNYLWIPEIELLKTLKNRLLKFGKICTLKNIIKIDGDVYPLYTIDRYSLKHIFRLKGSQKGYVYKKKSYIDFYSLPKRTGMSTTIAFLLFLSRYW